MVSIVTSPSPAAETSTPPLAETVLNALTLADQSAIMRRLASLLPPSWFGTGLTEVDDQTQQVSTPVLNTVLAGPAYNLAWIYVLYKYVLTQSRIATATGVWLDRISYDFCGNRLPRMANESDDSYRLRIIAEIFRPRQTRLGITDVMLTLTGVAPKIIELWNPGDTLTYGSNGLQGYGQAGMYGSLLYHNQVLVTAYRPLNGEGIQNIPGYGTPYFSYGSTSPGSYVDIGQMNGPVTDADIYSAIAGIIAAGNTAWVAIADQTLPTGPAQMYFGNIENTQDEAILFFYF